MREEKVSLLPLTGKHELRSCDRKNGISFFPDPSYAFDWMACAEDFPLQNTRLFGLDNNPSHFASWAVSSGTPALNRYFFYSLTTKFKI